ncbi:hypothetical protein C8Q80DRAFT_955965 [Daedaleopsis nitida]|nr:hypothetical protein C8Q80DRAFT_955965 [Daedaleopsis nitida]
MAAIACRVCKTTLVWTLPLLYHTVTLQSVDQIESFGRALDGDDSDTAVAALSRDRPLRATLVRRLWIGPTSFSPNNVHPGPVFFTFDVQLVLRLLPRCSSLAALSLIGYNPDQQLPLLTAAPSSVSSLCLQPTDGVIALPTDTQWAPNLRSLTTLNTFMHHDVRIALASSPTIHLVRPRYEIVYIEETKERAARQWEEDLKWIPEELPAWVTFVPWGSRVDGREMGDFAVLYHHWLRDE